MTRQIPTLMFALALALVLSACNGAFKDMLPMGEPEAPPVPGFVTDLPAFEQFVAIRPAPEEFRRRYPDLTLVLPGEIATKEFRMNNSRYFAKLDEEGRIVGGRFM